MKPDEIERVKEIIEEYEIITEEEYRKDIKAFLENISENFLK